MIDKAWLKSLNARLYVAVANAWVQTIVDISRKPNIHSLVIISIPPMLMYTCDDTSKVCELYMYNLADELERAGLYPIFKQQGARCIVEIYEKLSL